MARRREQQSQAKLDTTRFAPLFGLTISELLMAAVLFIFFPLFSLGINLPFLPKALMVISYPLIGVLLFLVKRDGLPASIWLGIMLPFWMRQRAFRLAAPPTRLNRAGGLLDRAVGASINAVSLRWERAEDGMLELHVYEDPRRPYRAAAVLAAAERRRMRWAARFPRTMGQRQTRAALNQQWLEHSGGGA